MTDILIIGSGPAGISAALYAARAGMDTLVVSSGQSALFKAHMIENYYGGSISGDELYKKGIAHAKELGVEIKEDQVVGLGFDGDFIVTGEKSQYKAKAVIISTGSARKAPPLPGLSEFEGRGVSYCAVCDGFFHRGKNVAVLGSGTYALHEAMELSPIVESVTILTDGQAPEFSLPDSLLSMPRSDWGLLFTLTLAERGLFCLENFSLESLPDDTPSSGSSEPSGSSWEFPVFNSVESS